MSQLPTWSGNTLLLQPEKAVWESALALRHLLKIQKGNRMIVREVLKKYHKKATDPAARKQMLVDGIGPEKFLNDMIRELNHTKPKNRRADK